MNPHELHGSPSGEVPNQNSSTSIIEVKSNKRGHDEGSDSELSGHIKKVPKLCEPSNRGKSQQSEADLCIKDITSTSSLLALSDDVLLHIFGYLDSVTLTRLNRTCHRLKNICSDPTLWKVFNTNGLPLTVTEFKTMVKYFNKRTTCVTIHGFLKIRSKMHLSLIHI